MRRSVAAIVLLVVGMCTLSARTPGQQPEGYPAIGAPAIVKLISAGSAPRSALRYAVPADAREHMNMTMKMGMSMDMGGASMPGMTMPGITMGIDLAMTDVSPAGDLTYTVAFSGVTAEAGADPMFSAPLQEMNDVLKSIKGSATISNRGVVRAFTVDLSKIAGSQLGQMLGSMSETMKNVSTPLPEEEVGIGARWEVRNAMDTNGLKMFQKTEFELVAFDGKTVTLKTKVEQTAPQQAISNPAMPAGADIQLEKFSSAGSTSLTLRLNGLVPTADGSMESTMAMQINLGGTTQQMAVTTSLKMTIAPGK